MLSCGRKMMGFAVPGPFYEGDTGRGRSVSPSGASSAARSQKPRSAAAR